MTRYFSWEFDSNRLVEYERRGECNMCGECCRALITLHHKSRNHDGANDSPSTDRRGTWGEARPDDGPEPYFLRVASVEKPEGYHCEQLTPNNICLMHDFKKRMHREWPFHPDQVSPFPNCSYQFVQIAEGPIPEEPT